MTPVIILGGILGGVFTPTEASAVAVAYSLVISLFVLKSMVIRDLPKVLTEAAMTSSVVLLLVGAAMAFKTVVSLSHTPEILAEWILTLSENPLINLVLGEGGSGGALAIGMGDKLIMLEYSIYSVISPEACSDRKSVV